MVPTGGYREDFLTGAFVLAGAGRFDEGLVDLDRFTTYFEEDANTPRETSGGD